MTIGHVYTLTEAADLTGVSRSTIRRRHKDGAFPNAYKDSEGNWKVPLTDLEQAGIRPRSSDRAQPKSARSAPVTLTSGQDPAQSPTPPVSASTERVVELAKRERELLLEVDKYRDLAHQAERDVSELKGFIRGMEGTLEESKNNNRELSARNADLTRALIAIEAKVAPVAEPGVVVGETVPMAQEPAPAPEPARPEPAEPQAGEPTPKRKWWQW